MISILFVDDEPNILEGLQRMLRPMLLGENLPRYLLGICTDMTERRGLENQLRHAQKMESIGQLAAGIAHEINTPTQYVGDNTRFVRESFSDLETVLGKFSELLSSARVQRHRRKTQRTAFV